MIIDDITDLTKGSHKIVNIKCDYKTSEKCLINYKRQYKDVLRYRKNNNNKDICLQCSRRNKHSGRNNPNCKYIFDDNLMENIDSNDKAYLLGWIASDGHIRKKNDTICISIHNKDVETLKKLRDIVCKDIPIKKLRANMVSLTINSSKINKDCCKHLRINGGKKSNIVNFPNLKSEELQWRFLAGYFDGDGCVTNCRNKKTSPKCDISSNSYNMLLKIKEFCKIPCSLYKSRLEWGGVNALDFMGKLYDNNEIKLDRKYELFCEWCNWVPSIKGCYKVLNNFNINKCKPNAIFPSKSRVSDSGFDVSIIDIVNKIGNVIIYGTGIKVRPDFGYYVTLVPRSSIIKSGYMLANSIGIIDRSYVGEVLVALIKTDPNAQDLQLPCKIAQLIPQQVQHFKIVEVNNFDDTDRGCGGFGSTDKK